MNAFVNETRDSRMALDIDGLVGKLRAPETLHRLVMAAKPATMSVGDFCLKAMFDGVLMAAIMRSDYRAAYSTLVTILGADVTSRHDDVTNVTDSQLGVTNGDIGGPKRFAKAGAR